MPQLHTHTHTHAHAHNSPSARLGGSASPNASVSSRRRSRWSRGRAAACLGPAARGGAGRGGRRAGGGGRILGRNGGLQTTERCREVCTLLCRRLGGRSFFRGWHASRHHHHQKKKQHELAGCLFDGQFNRQERDRGNSFYTPTLGPLLLPSPPLKSRPRAPAPAGPSHTAWQTPATTAARRQRRRRPCCTLCKHSRRTGSKFGSAQ